MKTIKQKEEFFNKISEQLEFDIMDYFQTEELEDINDYDVLEEKLSDEGAFDVNIIYYVNAMKYLMEHDNSLQESMEIADEYGYDTKNINSELLASLLASRNARYEFFELQSEIDQFFIGQIL